MALRRLFIALINCFLIVSTFANNKNLEKDVLMVSYEQGWLDSRGTIALKNNTDEEIHNVDFQITYLDMSGAPLDYENYSKEISIAPGMTKKVDIPAYEHNRSYHYYKSEGSPSGSPAFKIEFQLKDYNVKTPELEEQCADNLFERYNYSHSEEKRSGNGRLIILVGLVVILFVIGLSIGLYVLVAVMAQNRNRNVAMWILLSLLATPLLMIIILLFIGKDNNNTLEQHYER